MDTIQGDVCIPNISARERRRRLAGGIAGLVAGLILLLILVATGVNPWWRLAVFPLFVAAATGYFQWREKT